MKKSKNELLELNAVLGVLNIQRTYLKIKRLNTP